jgi:RES domain-containing protein
VLYTSLSMAMACLETFVHLNAGALPLNRYLVELTIPGWIWTKAQRETAASLRVGWDAEPAGRVSIDFGTQWIASKSTAVLVIPSAIIPEEFNILINPQHPDCAGISARKIRKWLYDPRLQTR